MNIFQVNRSEIEGRLDPFYYDPYFFSIINKLKSKSKSLKQLNVNIRKGVFDLSPTKYRTHGIPFLRVADLKEGTINFEKTVFIDEKTHLEQYRTEYLPNDLVFSKVGTLGEVSLLPDTYSKYNISQNIIGLRCSEELKKIVFPEFLQIFFLSNFGKIQLLRETSFGVQPKITLEALKNIYVPILSKDIQQIIINFYKKANSLRLQQKEQAKKLLESIDTYLLSELGITLPEKDNSLSKRMFTVKFSEVNGGRLDPFWQIAQEQKLHSTQFKELSVKDLASLQKGTSITSDKIISGDYPVIAGGQTSPYSHNSYNFTGNTITISASGAYSGFVWYHENPIFASDCTVLKSLNEEICSTVFLYEILRLKQGELYNLQQGAGQPHVYPNDIAKIQIPLPPLSKQKEITDHIKSIRNQAKTLQNEAEQILADAKTKVEKMILGEKNA